MTQADRQAYADKLRARLKQYDAEISKLRAQIDELHADARIEHDARLRELRTQFELARERMQELERRTGAAWEEAKTGLDLAREALEQGIQDAARRLRGM